MRTTKHIAVLVALAAAFAWMLAGALPAFAAHGDSTYLDWDAVAGLPGNASSTGPHGDYVTNTVKCGVCHAIHGAAASGEALLQTNRANACTYCHVAPGVSNLTVYGGSVANYSGGDLKNAHNTTSSRVGQDGVTCVECHQVHKAQVAMTANNNLSMKILSGPKTDLNVYGDPLYDPRAGAPLAGEPYADALSKWCTKCHFQDYGYYTRNRDDDTHVMGLPSNDYLASNGSMIGTVAYAASTNCSDCHSSGYLTGAWPHFTPGQRFLEEAGDITQPKNAATNSTQDGVCLRCHKNGAQGVGGHF